MNIFAVPATMVPRTELSLIQDALPTGYEVAIGSGGLYSIRFLRFGVICAYANVKNGQVHFTSIEEGHAKYEAEKFMKALVEKYPTENPDREVWQIFVPWHGSYTFFGERWYPDQDVALAQAFRFPKRANGSFLCSFRLGDLQTGGPFLTLSSHKLEVSEDCVHPGRDKGPMLINLTSLEACAGKK
ncbi:MAG: hypothetical protein ACD_61C00200G0001 [uncultured bacterium]|nr:MAG: hypothetical protein ACD_61C00200G0001 [uncultured bacterium]